MRGERGSVSILVAAIAGALLVLAMGATDVARVLTAAASAQGAADAAALAAAQELALPSGTDPADVAEEYAWRNGAAMTACSCRPGGSEAEVVVMTPVGPLFLFPDDRVVTAAARAVVDLPTG